MYNVYGVECATYEEACYVAGVDTPEQAAAEEEYWYLRWLGGKETIGSGSCCYPASTFDDIPF